MRKTVDRILMTVGVALLVSSGCSSIQVVHHSRGIQPPFCRNGMQGSTVAVYWDSAWRHDQKEVELRERIFTEGLAEFFRENDCIRTTKISRTIGSKSVSMSTYAELTSDANASGAAKTIIMRIEELGPNLMLYLSPILWQTKNEVLLRVTVIDTKTGSIDTDTASHWFRGGPFTVLGTGSLNRDLRGTLKAMFHGSSE
jgi:hypothetical protein